MTTVFPTSLDSLPNPSPTDHLNDPTFLHSKQHENINDAAEAIQTKIGINLSSIKNTLDYNLNLFLLTQIQHYEGVYAERETITGKIFPLRITWYTSSSKIIKLVDREYTYGSNLPVPTTITMRLYNGTVANTILRTITDVITYNKVFEISRIRTVT